MDSRRTNKAGNLVIFLILTVFVGWMEVFQYPAIAKEHPVDGWQDSNSFVIGGHTPPGGSIQPVEEPPSGGNANPHKGAAAAEDPYEYYAYYGCPLPGAEKSGQFGDSCKLNPECEISKNHNGIKHRVYRRLKSGGKWQLTGESYCAAPGSQTPKDAEKHVVDPEPVVTQEEFQKMPIKPMGVVLQPGVNTLKNYNTNVYLSGDQQVLNTQILGRPVRVRATPVAYVYDYGDGTRRGPVKDKGKALSQEAWDVETSTSHRYARTGDFSVIVTTVYSGEFSVAGGEWQPIDGTASIASDPQALTVWRTRSGWVQDGCTEKPSGWGC